MRLGILVCLDSWKGDDAAGFWRFDGGKRGVGLRIEFVGDESLGGPIRLICKVLVERGRRVVGVGLLGGGRGGVAFCLRR